MTATELYKLRPERWFRFSLRTMLVLLTLATIGFGWFTAQLKWMHDRHAALDWIVKNGLYAEYKLWADGSFQISYATDPDNEKTSVDIDEFVFKSGGRKDAVNAPGMLPLFGESGIGKILLLQSEDQADASLDAKAQELRHLFPEAKFFGVSPRGGVPHELIPAVR